MFKALFNFVVTISNTERETRLTSLLRKILTSQTYFDSEKKIITECIIFLTGPKQIDPGQNYKHYTCFIS